MERQNSGIFRCIADNGVREPVFIDMQLNVLCKSFYFIWNLYSKQFKPILLNYTIEQNEQQNLQFHSNICECGQISMGNSDYDNKNIREIMLNWISIDVSIAFFCVFDFILLKSWNLVSFVSLSCIIAEHSMSFPLRCGCVLGWCREKRWFIGIFSWKCEWKTTRVCLGR